MAANIYVTLLGNSNCLWGELERGGGGRFTIHCTSYILLLNLSFKAFKSSYYGHLLPDI